jgi:hypothetical protein
MLVPGRVIGLFAEVIDSHGMVFRGNGLPVSSSAKADDPVFIDILAMGTGASTNICDYWMPRIRGA